MRILLYLLVPVLLAAQPWSSLQSKNPPGLQPVLRLLEPRAYREGELIRVEVTFRGESGPTPGRVPNSFWSFGGVLLHPAGTCGSLSTPCYPPPENGPGDEVSLEFRRAGNFGGSGNPPQPLPLNRYLPHLRPGRYRVAVQSREQVLLRRDPSQVTYGRPTPPRYVVSNTVEFQVIPATSAWQAQTIAASVAVLNVGQTVEPPGNYQARRSAADQLAALDISSAWAAALSHLSAEVPNEEWILLRGMATTREPTRVCALMEDAIPQPSLWVTPQYLRTASAICTRAKFPAEAKENWPRRHEFTEDRLSQFTASLANSLARKKPEAKTSAILTLMARVRDLRYGNPPRAIPPWADAVKADFLRRYPSVEKFRQRHFLETFVSTFPSPDIVQLVETVMDNWAPGQPYETPREALRHLHSFAPARAESRIIAELSKSQTWLDKSDLALLPASSATFGDGTLIAALAESQHDGGWNPQLRFAALAKYASTRALDRIKAIYTSQKDPCQPELMAYFVRVDPDFADRIFHQHSWDMQTAPPRCALQYFARTPPLAMGPPLERYLSAYLNHAHVNVKQAAAEALGRYGSPSSVSALWSTLRYFHDYWKDRREELEQNQEGVNFEFALRNAIAHGRNWLTTEADLHLMESLCVSGRCIGGTREDLQTWRKPLRIELNSYSGRINARVAQYFAIESIDALEEKLSQFPSATQFLLRTHGSVNDETVARLRRFCGDRGLVLVEAVDRK